MGVYNKLSVPPRDSISHLLLWWYRDANELNTWVIFQWPPGSEIACLPRWMVSSLWVDLDSILIHFCTVTRVLVTIGPHLWRCWMQDRVPFLLLGNIWYYLTLMGFEENKPVFLCNHSSLAKALFFENRGGNPRRENAKPKSIYLFCKL